MVINGTLLDEDNNPVSGATIVVSVTSGNEAVALSNVTTGEDGSFTYTLSKDDLKAEEYDVNLNFEGQGNYLPSTAEVKVNVNQSIATSINTESVINITRKDDLVIAGILFDEDENAVGNVDILVIVQSGNELVASETVRTTGSGTFEYNLTKGNITKEEYNVIIKFEGQGNYLPSTAEVKVNVNQSIATTIITDKSITIDYDQDLVITGVIQDEDNKAVDTANINITIIGGDQTIEDNVTTNETGEFTYTLPNKDIKYDVYVVYLNFAGKDFYLASNATINVNVNHSKESFYQFEFDPISEVYVGNEATITGTLYYYQNQTAEAEIVADTPITINIEGNKFQTTTDNDGKFTITFITDEVGKFSVTGELYTDKKIKNDGSELIVNPESRVDINIEEPVLGEDVTLTANLTGVIGDTTGGQVIFRVNGKTLRYPNGTVIFVDVVNGTAELPDVAITGEWMKPETSIQAIFTGNDEYDSFVTDKTYLTVTKPVPEITITSEAKATVGQEATFTAKVKYGTEELNTGRVAFKLNGKTLKDAKGKALYVNVEDGGIATLKYVIPEKTKAKTYNLTAVFTDVSYDRCETVQQISIEKASA